MNWLVFCALGAIFAHLALNVVDFVRGKTVINGISVYCDTAPRHFWATLAFYLAGAAFLFLISVKVEAQRQHCEQGASSGSGSCFVPIGNPS